MKLSYRTILYLIFIALVLFNFTVQAEPIKISLNNILKQKGIEQEISKNLPGTESAATLISANIFLDGTNKIPGKITLTLKLKGKKYFIPYDFIVKSNIDFYIEQNCKITKLDIKSQTAMGHTYDTALFKAYWYFVKNSVEKQIALKITNRIKSIKNTELKMLCEL